MAQHRRSSGLEQFRRALYKTQRGIGTFETAERGGAPAVAKRLIRRRVTRTLMRGLWGN
jgi:hypothetical protein